ncbi:MAG: hypothetical protein J1E80_00190 [Desulfovibrionaceae bacterium]|nr:hypothetical protein [Desulfovibrionaceae bacterium]
MTMTAHLRLLNDGIPGPHPDGTRLAEPFSPQELAASPLAPASLGFSGTGVPRPDTVWREIRPDGELRMLECPCPGLPAPVYLAGHATSSLDAAHALIRRGALPEWGSVLVLSQSAGRGQLRRAWASPPGNIYAALRVPAAWPLNSTAAAPALGGLFAEALTRMGYAVALKWPNDILQAQDEDFFRDDASPLPSGTAGNWTKVGGILLEERGGALVAGVGLNIFSAPPPSALRDAFALPAGVLHQKARDKPDRQHAGSARRHPSGAFIPLVPLWTLLVGLIISCYFPKNNGTEESWWPGLAQRHLAFRGCRVRLEDALPESNSGTQRSSCEGVVEGLCVSGALRLRVRSDEQTFLGGSLIPMQ